MRIATTYIIAAAALIAAGPAFAAPKGSNTAGVRAVTSGVQAAPRAPRRGYVQFRQVDELTTGSTRPFFETRPAPIYPTGNFGAPASGGTMGGPTGGP